MKYFITAPQVIHICINIAQKCFDILAVKNQV